MLPAETPKLAKWPFLLGDALLLGTAWLIADQNRNPFVGQPLVWIVVCVVAAAILGAVPFLADYARKQDEALDERQRGLDAISRTVAASAEQISIAANGLHELTELAQRNLKAASQLGPGLEEKVAALKAELTATRDDDRAALRQEIAALRAAETQRVEVAAQQLAKTAAEILRVESALQKEIAAARELCATTGDLAVTLNGITEALQAARAAALAPPAPAGATAAPEAAAENPAAKPEPKRSRKSSAPAEGLETPPPVPTESGAPEPTPAPGEAASPPAPEPIVAAAPVPTVTVSSPAPEPAPTAEVPPAPPESEAPAPARKRAPRKPRAETAAEPVLEIPVVMPAPEPAPTETPAVASSGATAIISDLKSEISNSDSAPAPATEENPPAESDEPAKTIEQSRSSDGATRLLVTAYIGIGNRLFIRGAGPGLSWEKGLPLQFVSIGKWRWESSDVTGPVKYKLYKNDAVECTALGEQQVDPGQQQEVAAAF